LTDEGRFVRIHLYLTAKDMRVISGKARSIPLKAPQLPTVRPATDLVKGAIFSIIELMADDWSLILDLFSGSGQLGIEALSRGAGQADFVDREPRCCDIIRQNLEKTKLAEQAHVYCCSVAKAISFLDREYNIILMDPPYKDTTIGEVITPLANSRLVGNKTIIVITHSAHFNLEQSYGAIKMVKERRHGDSVIAIYQKEAQNCQLPCTPAVLTP
jgi:16S rRNA (guanine966-N2)-methyltransferase